MGEVEIVVDGVCVWTSATSVREPAAEEVIIRDATEAVEHFKAIRDMQREAFAVLPLNGANTPVHRARVVTVGLLDSNQVHPREVFADPITDRAASIIVAHNHPSGTLEPSAEDIAITRRLAKAGEILGVRVLDHLIMTAEGFISLKERNCGAF